MNGNYLDMHVDDTVLRRGFDFTRLPQSIQQAHHDLESSNAVPELVTA